VDMDNLLIGTDGASGRSRPPHPKPKDMRPLDAFELPPPFDEAVERHERELMRFLLRTTRDQEDALDLYQETWLRAYRAWPKLESAAGLRPWLYRIATNLCLNRTRDRMRRSRVIGDEEVDLTSVPGHSDGAHEGMLHLKALIARLPHNQREALVMRKFGGLEYAEIASALGCSADSARAGVYQALKKLKLAAEL
jgi:RNA polymerase sigma-70 factor (ECF subfamily)